MIKKILLINSLFFLSVFAQGTSKGNTSLNKTINYISPYSFNVTVTRVENELKKMNIPIFGKFDHSKNAKEVGLDLKESTVIVFGSPKVGTLLMQKNPEIAIELPLKLLILTNENNQTEINLQNIKKTAENYNLQNEEIILNMEKLLNNLVEKSIGSN